MNRDLLTRLLSCSGVLLFISLLFVPGCDSGASNGGGISSGTAPASPTGISVSPGNAKGTIMIHWDGIRGTSYYIIYSSTTPEIENNKFKSKRKVVKPNFTISGLTSGKTYYFAVTAINGSGESRMSREVSGMAP